MDRVAAMLILLGMLASTLLFTLALFAVAPIFCSCLVSLLYTLYLFISNETSGVHHAQEFENRFWTVFALLLSTALFFAKDSPIALGQWSPTMGFVGVVASGFGMHAWDRHSHRKEISRQVGSLRRGASAAQSLNRLKALGVPVEDQLAQINACLADIDQLLIPSTINNFINQRFILRKEREIITIFEEAEPKALNFLISHVKLGLLFYKIKDHRNFHGQHRTELIELLAVDRISVLTVLSRVIVLHALQVMKLPANARAEYWVRNIMLCTRQDDLSELKTLTDTKGDYFCMNKLIFEDIRSETVRQDILNHIRKEANIQQAHMAMRTRKSKLRLKKAWRKVLSDVDDTLTCSGGSYPAGIDRRYGKKVVYPGVLAFYRELDLGTQGPEEWPQNAVGNLVFLSARPHVYKDMSEKQNFAKFEKLRSRGNEGRGGMHTTPSLLAGDMASGRDYIVTNDFEPLALKKFENFKRYVSIYPEFKHVFICDNGQGDVRAGELMFDAFPEHLEALYVHVVQDISKTHGYNRDRWKKKGLKPCFFKTYPDAALHAARRNPPLIRVGGLRRVCQDCVNDFYLIQTKQWPSQKHKWDRRDELNQALWRANEYLSSWGEDPVPLIEAERLWKDGQKVRTPYGIGTVRGFDPVFDVYQVELDWRPLDVQLAEYKKNVLESKIESGAPLSPAAVGVERAPSILETVVETSEEIDDDNIDIMSVVPNSECSVEQSAFLTNGDHVSLSDSPIPPVLDGDRISPQDDVSEQKRTAVLTKKTYGNENGAKSSKSAHPYQSSPTGMSVRETPKVNEISVTESPSLSATDKATLTSGTKNKGKPVGPIHPVFASIQGRCMSKYTPPKLPALAKEDKGRSIFSFWGAGGETKEKSKQVFKPGDKCNTPYGPATVVEHRLKKGIVVVDMIGWSARGYLQESCVKVISKSLLKTLLRRIGAGENSETSSSQKRVAPPKELDFVYTSESVVQTPFGTGLVSRPLPVPKDLKEHNKPDTATKEGADKLTTSSAEDGSLKSSTQISTIGVSLTSWELGNKTNPVLYCTPDTAREWKKMELDKDGKPKTSNLLYAFGTLVSNTVRRITAQPEKKPIDAAAIAPRYERYYRDGAAVTTSYGDGVVRSFRESDGFYEVILKNWTMKGGVNPTAYLRKDDLSYRIAKGCHEGYPVLTSLGVSGILASVEPSTGVHIVTVPSAGMVCYLQPESIIRPLKAAVGEDVLTPYGEGRVRKYRLRDDMYEIVLSGCGAVLYAQGETFDRVDDGINDRGGAFGMNWLLRFLFFASDNKQGGDGSSRSRSNSIASIRSQKSVMSLT